MKENVITPEILQALQEEAKNTVLRLVRAGANRKGEISNLAMAYGLLLVVDLAITSMEECGDKGKTRTMVQELITKYFRREFRIDPTVN